MIRAQNIFVLIILAVSNTNSMVSRLRVTRFLTSLKSTAPHSAKTLNKVLAPKPAFTHFNTPTRQSFLKLTPNVLTKKTMLFAKFCSSADSVYTRKLPQEFYDKAGKELLEKTNLSSFSDEVKEFLTARQKDFTTVKSGNMEIASALEMLDLDLAFFNILRYVKRELDAEFVGEFVVQSSTLTAKRVREILNCYTNELEYHTEKMEKVTEEGFVKRVKAFDRNIVRMLFLEELNNLADHLIKDIK